MKRLNDAISIAKLDNHADLDADFLSNLEEKAKGNLTPEELESEIKQLLNIYRIKTMKKLKENDEMEKERRVMTKDEELASMVALIEQEGGTLDEETKALGKEIIDGKITSEEAIKKVLKDYGQKNEDF